MNTESTVKIEQTGGLPVILKVGRTPIIYKKIQ